MSGYQVDTNGQFITAVISAAGGVILCLLYDLLRLARYARRPTALWAFVQDIAWWLTATAVTGLVLLVRCRGEVRFFAIMGLAVGFLCCRFTLSLLFVGLGKRIIDLVKGVLRAINNQIFAPVLKAVAIILSKSLKKSKKFVNE